MRRGFVNFREFFVQYGSTVSDPTQGDAVWIEYLDTMVVAFDNEKAVIRIDQHIVGFVELPFCLAAAADGFEMIALCVEFLHTVVPTVRYVDVTFSINSAALWVVEFTQTFALASEMIDAMPVRAVDLNPVIEIVRQDEISRLREGKSGRGR